jgi:hypothetical protein
MVQVASGELTARDLIRLAIDALPGGWQATALPGYVILYHEDATYASAPCALAQARRCGQRDQRRRAARRAGGDK